MESGNTSRRLRRALGAVLCCAGLVAAGVLGSTDGQPMPPNPGGGVALAGPADGSPLPAPHGE